MEQTKVPALIVSALLLAGDFLIMQLFSGWIISLYEGQYIMYVLQILKEKKMALVKVRLLTGSHRPVKSDKVILFQWPFHFIYLCIFPRLHEQLNESEQAAQCYIKYIQDIYSCGVRLYLGEQRKSKHGVELPWKTLSLFLPSSL